MVMTKREETQQGNISFDSLLKALHALIGETAYEAGSGYEKYVTDTDVDNVEILTALYQGVDKLGVLAAAWYEIRDQYADMERERRSPTDAILEIRSMLLGAFMVQGERPPYQLLLNTTSFQKFIEEEEHLDNEHAG